MRRLLFSGGGCCCQEVCDSGGDLGGIVDFRETWDDRGRGCLGEEGAGGRWGAGMDMALGEESSQGQQLSEESRWAWNHDGTAALPHWNRPGDCEKRGGDERDGFVQSPPGLLIGGQFSLLLLLSLLPLASSMSCPFAFSGASCDASARDLPSIVHCLEAAVWILIQQTQRPVQPSGQEVSMVKLFGETPCPTPLTGERATPPSRRPHHHATPTVTHQAAVFASCLFPPAK